LFGLVNNAGVSKYPGSKESLFKISCEYDVDKEVLPVIDINLVGLIRMTTKFVPLLLENKKVI
jgi:short-subunit dehydrogenase